MIYLILVVCFTLSGLLLSKSIGYFLFKQQLQGTPGGLASRMLKQHSGRLGLLVADNLLSDPKLLNSLSGESLLQKIKPEISNHIDHFLEVKLKSVFPLLSQFMGTKTRDQLKGAFMDEMDRLFPEVMTRIHTELLSRENIADMVASKLNTLNTSQPTTATWINKNIQQKLDAFCSIFMLAAGLISCLIIYFVK